MKDEKKILSDDAGAAEKYREALSTEEAL